MTIKYAVGRLSYEFQYILLKIEKLSEFLILLSRLFHSVTMDEKYEFLEKSMSNIELMNIFNVSYSVCTSNHGDIIE